MTETEWLERENPAVMLEFLRGNFGNRKARLFAAACCRRVWHLLANKEIRKAVEVAEAYADGLATADQLSSAYSLVYRGIGADNVTQAWVRRYEATCAAAYASSPDAFDGATRTTGLACAALVVELDSCIGDNGECSTAARAVSRAEEVVHSAILRDICGNPFRPAAPRCGRWAAKAVSLAEAAYDKSLLPSGRLDETRLAVT